MDDGQNQSWRVKAVAAGLFAIPAEEIQSHKIQILVERVQRGDHVLAAGKEEIRFRDPNLKPQLREEGLHGLFRPAAALQGNIVPAKGQDPGLIYVPDGLQIRWDPPAENRLPVDSGAYSARGGVYKTRFRKFVHIGTLGKGCSVASGKQFRSRCGDGPKSVCHILISDVFHKPDHIPADLQSAGNDDNGWADPATARRLKAERAGKQFQYPPAFVRIFPELAGPFRQSSRSPAYRRTVCRHAAPQPQSGQDGP